MSTGLRTEGEERSQTNGRSTTGLEEEDMTEDEEGLNVRVSKSGSGPSGVLQALHERVA